MQIQFMPGSTGLPYVLQQGSATQGSPKKVLKAWDLSRLVLPQLRAGCHRNTSSQLQRLKPKSPLEG